MKLIALGAFALATLVAGAASAQTAPPATVNHGPAIAGVCIYNPGRVLTQSTAGQALSAGMQRLQTEVAGEIQPYQTSIQSEGQALQQAGASLPADQRAQREQALQQRYQEYQQLLQTREQELRYTEAVQSQTIGNAAAPLIAAAYQEKSCSILLDRQSVFLGNPAMDITETVLQRLNAAMPSLPAFNRMPVPVQQQ